MVFALASGLVAAPAAAQPLRGAIQARIGDFPGTVSLYAKNLDTGASIGIREAEPLRTASTIKLAIMMAVFDAVARGKAKWTDTLTVTAAEKVSGSGIIASDISDGVQLPIRDVVERFTADAVNAYLDGIGIRTTRSLRKIRGDGTQLKAAEGWSAAGKLPENEKYGLGVSTPRDMVTLLEKLERGEAVNAEASHEMIAILKRQQDSTGIRRRIRDVPIANKTGALDALRSDVGIVYAKTGRIAIAITVEGIPKVDYSPDNPGSLMIADLARILVDGLGKK
jgi:beta-lactamase class A